MIQVFKIESNQFSLFLQIIDSSLYQLTKLTKLEKEFFLQSFPSSFSRGQFVWETKLIVDAPRKKSRLEFNDLGVKRGKGRSTLVVLLVCRSEELLYYPLLLHPPDQLSRT